MQPARCCFRSPVCSFCYFVPFIFTRWRHHATGRGTRFALTGTTYCSRYTLALSLHNFFYISVIQPKFNGWKCVMSLDVLLVTSVIVNAREWFTCTSRCSNHTVTCPVLIVTWTIDGFSRSLDSHCMHSEKTGESRLTDAFCYFCNWYVFTFLSYVYTVSQKKHAAVFLSITWQNSVTAGLSKKFVARLLLHFPSHFKHVATLPCEIQKIKNNKNLTCLTQ